MSRTQTTRRTKLRAVPDLMAQLQEAQIRTRLKEARVKAGLSRARMADLLTVHPKSVENYEVERVPWQLVNAWAEITGTSVEFLLHGKKPTLEVDNGDRLERIEALLVEIRNALRGQAGLPALDPALEPDAPSEQADQPGEVGAG